MHSKSMLAMAVSALALVYFVFLVMYLQHAEKNDIYMSQRDQNVRKVAVIWTWVSIVVVSMSLVCSVACMMGYKMPHKMWSKLNM